MDQFTVTSAKPFDDVVAAIKISIGNPNMDEFWKSMQGQNWINVIRRVRSRDDRS